MDTLVPAAAVVIGLAILAPGFIRTFKKKNDTQNENTACGGCGGCDSAGCNNAGTPTKPNIQLIQLKNKQRPSGPPFDGKQK